MGTNLPLKEDDSVANGQLLKIINHNADKEVATTTKEVSIMRNKIFVTRADFTFDLQRFADNVTYLDANGTEQTVSDYTTLTGNETTLTAGWYLVDSDITIDHTLNISGEVHLILADGAKLTVNGDTGYGIDCNSYSDKLNIYG